MSIVAYKNKNTGQVVAYPAASPRLDALDEWERTDNDGVTYTIADAHDRAAAERESIEAAAAVRLDSAVGAAARGVAFATAANTAPELGRQPDPLPTLSTGSAGENGSLVSVLDKSHSLRDPATTSFEENKRRADEELAHPPTTGVLARAKRDQKSGATQIGPNPEEHAGPAAAAAASAAGIDPAGDTPATVPAVGTNTGTVADGTAPTDSPEPGTDGGTAPAPGTDGSAVPARPTDSALKPDWVDYAVLAKGVDREVAEAKTKQQLIDEHGQ